MSAHASRIADVVPYDAPDADATEAVVRRLAQAQIFDLDGAPHPIDALPERVVNDIHAYAHTFYQQGRLAEAEAFFRFLCLYDFHNADYAMGLAAVFQFQGRHRQAVDLYGVALRLGILGVGAVFHAGQCFLKLGEIDDARECFAYAAHESRDASLAMRASNYLASIGGLPDADCFDRHEAGCVDDVERIDHMESIDE
ncbi:tetratricopeptide repeat protein [Pararobbsia silviterrae]|uniref:tetratricopeptide repeat protein n=1 Tax=Pararobbsia silviterrae TaxID=1792498 RepID=UPI0013140A49